MVFNTTFNNISVILWWSVLLVEETKVYWGNYWPVPGHWRTLSHNVVSSTPRHELEFKLTILVEEIRIKDQPWFNGFTYINQLIKFVIRSNYLENWDVIQLFINNIILISVATKKKKKNLVHFKIFGSK